MRKIPREVVRCCNRNDPVETIRRRLSKAQKSELEFYILGALHDATFSKIHKTFRISQSNISWLIILKEIVKILGRKSWIYKEGKKRSVWILETSMKFDLGKKPESIRDKKSYIRGYFDAEGGMPKSQNHFLYLQFSQKNQDDLTNVKEMLDSLGYKCGRIHNPSRRVDKNYWRFFLSRDSHARFMQEISSWHPRKSKQIELRMKI